MEDVLAVYELPYDPRQPWFAWMRSRLRCMPPFGRLTAGRPGREARRDASIARCGTANVFCAVEPKAGRHFTRVTADRSGPQFAQAVFEIAMAYPEAVTIHLVVDNLSTHSRKSLTDLCGEELAARSGTLHAALHAASRQLAESGRDRDRPVRAAMPGQKAGLQLAGAQARSRRLEPLRQPRAHQNRLENSIVSLRVEPFVTKSHDLGGQSSEAQPPVRTRLRAIEMRYSLSLALKPGSLPK